MSISTGAPGAYVYENGDVFCDIFPANMLNKIKNEFMALDDDVIISTYPKSGTIWLQEIVYLINSNCDTEQASKTDSSFRVPFIEFVVTKLYENTGRENGFDIIQKQSSSRMIKTHLKPEFYESTLKKTNAKFIILSRNIKDVLVSYYHFSNKIPALGGYEGSFDEYFELFKEKMLVHGDWFDFVSEWWTTNKDNPNVLFIFYEDMIKDIKSEISKIATFLNKDLSDDLCEKIIEYVSFDKLKQSKSGKNLRKGGVGGWRDYINEEQNNYIDKLYNEKIVPLGLSFDF